jgi:hypothetical protein
LSVVITRQRSCPAVRGPHTGKSSAGLVRQQLSREDFPVVSHGWPAGEKNFRETCWRLPGPFLLPVSDTLPGPPRGAAHREEIGMNTIGKLAAMGAGGLATASAIAVGIFLPIHHAAPAGTVTSVSAGQGTATPGSGTGQSASGAGDSASGGSGSGTGTGGSGTGSSAGGSSSNNGSSGSGTGSGTSGQGTSGGSGSTSGSSGKGLIDPVISGLPHLILPRVTAIPSPTGTIGDPNAPCLEGYVWRQAYPGDYVCVTPANRTQAAADNAAALSRVQPGGGAYGKYTCKQGYVWRQVVTDDYTCVTPAVRSQAAYDNSQAAYRVEYLNLWVTDWTPASSPTNNCNGDVCTTTDGGGGPNFQVNGDGFNFGSVLVQVDSDSGKVLWSQTGTAGSYTGYTGGAFGMQTQIADCSAVPGTKDNDYVIAYDYASGRWSNRLAINSDCAYL